jgi:uncharacterized membrane protein
MTTLDGTGLPLSAGILFGLGLGGFFDGIVLHQVLQWRHILTDPPHQEGTLGLYSIQSTKSLWY